MGARPRRSHALVFRRVREGEPAPQGLDVSAFAEAVGEWTYDEKMDEHQFLVDMIEEVR